MAKSEWQYAERHNLQVIMVEEALISSTLIF
jgi:hypothetical protein